MNRSSLAAVPGLAALLLASCALIAGVEEGTLDPEVTGVGGGASTGASPQTAATGTSSGSGSSGATTAGASSGSQSGAGVGGGGAGGPGAGGDGAGGDGAAGPGAGGATSTGTGTGGGGDCPTATAGMVEIPAGVFAMGCNVDVDAQCSADEEPQHDVTLGCFLIDRYEVSRGDYFECVEAAECPEPEDDWDSSGTALQNHPVTFVTWQMADGYCTWAGKRLPTEAEWEKAARGEDGLKYPFGNQWGDGTPGGGDCSQANANLCLLDTTTVDSMASGASPYGAFHMGGNVAEWVADWYDADYYVGSPAVDPPGPASGALKVLRGGSWNSPVFDFRTSARDAGIPDGFATGKGFEIGFRCAK
jgi:formylglycine-generating enzyme required for sulfatase activity